MPLCFNWLNLSASRRISLRTIRGIGSQKIMQGVKRGAHTSEDCPSRVLPWLYSPHCYLDSSSNSIAFFAASTISLAVMLRSALHQYCVPLVLLVASLHFCCGKPA